MFDTFPREVGTERRIVFNEEEMYAYINRNKSIKDIYVSLYSFNVKGNSADYESAKIDKVFFDLDYELGDAYKDMLKLVRFAEDEGIRHGALFSGGGYHVYLKSNDDGVKSKKKALYNCHKKITKDLNLKSADSHIFGDLARIVRFPMTFNFKRRKYCTPIMKSDLDILGRDIEKLADERIDKIKFYGQGMIDIVDYEDLNMIPERKDIDIDINGSDDFFLLPCMNFIINQENPSHLSRFALVSYLYSLMRKGREPDALSYEEKSMIRDEISTYIKKIGWDDYNPHITRYQTMQIIERGYRMPTCEWLKSKGLCVKSNCEYK